MQPQIIQQIGANYINPFGGMQNIKPPLLVQLNELDFARDFANDSSSDFLDYEQSEKKRRKQIDLLEDRSEGEVGPMGSEAFEDSELGEVLDFDGFGGSK